MKKLILLLCFLICFGLSNLFAGLKLEVDVSAKGKRKIPITLVKFNVRDKSSDLTLINDKIFEIIKNDLDFSENFKIDVDTKSGFLNFNLPSTIKRFINKSEFIIQGEIGSFSEDEIYVKLKIYDIFLKENKLLKNFYGKKYLFRKIAHKISSNISEKLTGSPDIFEYKILFVSNKTGKKEIYLSDYTGNDIKALTQDGSINICPRIYDHWLIYTSFKNGAPRVFKKDLSTGRSEVLIKTGNFSAGADINLKRKKIVAMYGVGGNSEIGIFDMNGNLLKRITKNIFNDSSPVWSRDGSKIAYVSNRSGTPQIYVYDVDKRKTFRVTFTSIYSAYPSWGYDDNYLYFAELSTYKRFKVCRVGLRIFHYEELTKSDHSDEFPSISPDGKYILFTRKIGFTRQIFIKNLETNKIHQITFDKSDKSYPVWYKGIY